MLALLQLSDYMVESILLGQTCLERLMTRILLMVRKLWPNCPYIGTFRQNKSIPIIKFQVVNLETDVAGAD